jgi:hypothetical protein
MPAGTPKRVTDEFERRGELVRVTVRLERGVLEDLQVLCRHHYGDRTRAAVVRRAVGLLLAREAVQVARGYAIERRRAEKSAEEARAIAIAREDRDQEQGAATLAGALRIAGLKRDVR